MSAGAVIGDHAHLAHGNSFQDVNKVLKMTRLAVTWRAEIFAGAEAVYSYEGTDEINTVVTGPVACLACPMLFPSPPHALSTAPLCAGPR